MNSRLLQYLFLLLSLFLSMACRHDRPHIVDPWASTTIDSAAFQTTHHYWKNFHFLLVDSLRLDNASPVDFGYISTKDSVVLNESDVVVVVNLVSVPADLTDSIWVMVAKDDESIGWVRETDLLRSAVPDNPISRFIQAFSDSRIIILLVCLASALLFFGIQNIRKSRFQMVHFHDIKSFYPTLLCMVVSGSAVLYGAFQQFAPEMWEQFYYHPTLNFFESAPLFMRLFLLSVWVMLIVGLAVVDDLRKQPGVVDAVAYLASLSGVCMLLYLFFTWSVHFYVGYPLLPLYWAFALRRHWLHNSARYLCGNCGNALHRKGECPYCHAFND